MILPPTRFFFIRSYLLKLSAINLQNNSRVCGYTLFFGRGEVKIGLNSWISLGCKFHTNERAKIIIGNNCDVGPYVSFLTGTHVKSNKLRRAGRGIAKSIIVGDGVWIGANTIILPGVKIESGVIVAAGSVVKNNVPQNVLVAGCPAKIKKNL